MWSCNNSQNTVLALTIVEVVIDMYEVVSVVEPVICTKASKTRTCHTNDIFTNSISNNPERKEEILFRVLLMGFRSTKSVP